MLILSNDLQTAEERSAYVQDYLDKHPHEYLSQRDLSYISDYILMVSQKDQTKREKQSNAPILTYNRECTVNKREKSLEEIVSGLENGEDGLYALINNDKDQKLDHKQKLTEWDFENIPGLKEQQEIIDKLEEQKKTATGRKRSSLQNQIIETYQQMYVIKNSYRNPSIKKKSNAYLKIFAHLTIPEDDEDIYIDEKGYARSNAAVSLLNPSHISFLLRNYVQLKEETTDDLQSDMRYILMDLENLVEKALEHDELLYNLLIWKIDGLSVKEIQEKMDSQFGEIHSEPYYSTLWRKRIPKLIAEQAQKDYLIWYYTNIEKGNWKRCSKCGEIKLAHPLFFSKNTNKQGWYSHCKDCKNKKDNDQRPA